MKKKISSIDVESTNTSTKSNTLSSTNPDKKLKETFVKSFQAELSKYPELNLNAEQIALTIDKVERDYVKNTEVDYLDVIWYAQKKVFKRVVAGILVSTIGLVVYLYLFRK